MQNSLIAAVWLVLFRAKRPMRAFELQRRAGEISRLQCAWSLNACFKRGYIERSGFKGRYLYAVTARCSVPLGVQVREVLEAAS